MKRITPWQAEHLYVRPAAERGERMRRGSGGGGVPAGPPPAAHDWTDRAAFVAGMSSAFGGDVKRWEADWDRIRAARAKAAGGSANGQV